MDNCIPICITSYKHKDNLGGESLAREGGARAQPGHPGVGGKGMVITGSLKPCHHLYRHNDIRLGKGS